MLIVLWVNSESKELCKDGHAEQLEPFAGPEEMDGRAVSIWEWHLNPRLILVNNTKERWLLT